MTTIVYAVWGWYPGDKEDGQAVTILSVHRTMDSANKWAESHKLTDWWTYTYSVED